MSLPVSMPPGWRLLALALCGWGAAHVSAHSSMDGPSLPGMPAGGVDGQLDHLECRKCGNDLFDFALRRPKLLGSPPPSSRPAGMLRPQGVKPIGVAGRPHAPPEPKVGGKAVHLHASAYAGGPSDPNAAGYAGPHRPAETRRILGRHIKVHHLKNPMGREFEVVTVSALTNYRCDDAASLSLTQPR
jgi:hypothetical protein